MIFFMKIENHNKKKIEAPFYSQKILICRNTAPLLFFHALAEKVQLIC